MWMDKLHSEVSNREAAEREALLARQRSDARALELSAAKAHLARLEALRAEHLVGSTEREGLRPTDHSYAAYATACSPPYRRRACR